MAIIDNIDGPNRLIYLDVSTMNTDIHPIDIYKEMRTLRATDENLRKYDLFMRADGNIEKTSTTATERFVTLLDGTRIVPYDLSHVLTITGTIITDSGQSGVDCFDRTSLSPTTVVDINYVPPQVEIITVNTGSGVLPQDILDIADQVWNENTADHVTSDTTGAKIYALPSGMTRSEAVDDFSFLIQTDDGVPATGVSVTGWISKDGNSFALLSSITEIGRGFYKVDLSETNMDALTIALSFEATDCRATSISIVTC